MNLSLQPYEPGLAAEWDAFCAASLNASFLHTRRFLAYHGDRFRDASLLLRHEGALVGLLPAAALPDGVVASHPGATYGGLLQDGWLSGGRMLDALAAVKAHYASAGFQRLLYKPVPALHAPAPSQDDLYALFRLGARRSRCELSCAFDLGRRREPSERRRRGLKKAQKSVTVSREPTLLPALHAVIRANLAREHKAEPVHSLAELEQLRALFPAEIQAVFGLMDGQVEAGVILFNSRNAFHCQYIAASEKAYEASALDAVMDACIQAAAEAGARYFDLGTSNEDQGRVLNEGLYRYKSEFGGAGAAHEAYELDLRA